MPLFDSYHLVSASLDCARRIAQSCGSTGFLHPADGDALPSVIEYAVALLAIKYAGNLPPNKQSHSQRAKNIDNALALSCKELHNSAIITSRISFASLANLFPLANDALRDCIDLLHTLPEHHTTAYTRAISEVIQYAHQADSQTQRPLCLEKLITRIAGIYSGHSVGITGRYAASLQCHAIEEAQAHQSGFVNSVSLSVQLHHEQSDTVITARTLCILSTLFYGQSVLINHNTTHHYDSMLCIDDLGEYSVLPLIEHLLPTGQLLYVCTAKYYTEVLSKQEIPALLDRDVLESVVTLRPDAPEGGDSFVVLHIRGQKPSSKRHRILVAERIIIPNAPGYELTEEIAAVVRKFTTQDAHTVVTHRTKFTSKNYSPEPTYYAAKRYQFHNEIPLFGGVPHKEFSILVRSLHAHKIDVARYFIESDTSFVFFAPALASRQLIRIAISSAPSLRDQETRMHYTLAHWWYRNEQHLADCNNSVETIVNSFSHTLGKVGLLDEYVLRAVIEAWLHDFRSALISYHETGNGRQILDEWIAHMIYRIEREGTQIWNSLSLTESIIFESLAPALMQRIRSGSETLLSLDDEQFHPSFTIPESIRALWIEHNESTTIAERTRSVESRIAELQEFIQLQKQRIAELHRTAKKKTHKSDMTELFDSTLAIQDELGSIITRIVPAQTELRALEHILRPMSDIAERTDHTRRTIERLTNQLPASIRQMQSAINNNSASSIVFDVLRENLIAAIEESITDSREFIITTLEQWWDRYDVQAHSSHIETLTAS